MQLTLPIPVSLILCDELVHAGRRKEHLFGLFDTVWANTFPHRLARLGVFVALTGASGRYATRVLCLGPDGQELFGSPLRSVQLEHAQRVTRVFLRLEGVVFRFPGIYRLQLLCNNRLICERPFNVLLKGGNGDV